MGTINFDRLVSVSFCSQSENRNGGAYARLVSCDEPEPYHTCETEEQGGPAVNVTYLSNQANRQGTAWGETSLTFSSAACGVMDNVYLELFAGAASKWSYIKLEYTDNEITLPNVFDENMVLQQGKSTVYGKGTTGVRYTASLSNEKDIVADRIYNALSSFVYGHADHAYSGPMFDSFSVDGASVTVSFKPDTLSGGTQGGRRSDRIRDCGSR